LNMYVGSISFHIILSRSLDVSKDGAKLAQF
jgi:hypothetical protein